jgi:hypothetical protein
MTGKRDQRGRYAIGVRAVRRWQGTERLLPMNWNRVVHERVDAARAQMFAQLVARRRKHWKEMINVPRIELWRRLDR